MSHRVWARPARLEDVERLDKWLHETPQNLFDPEILRYQSNIRFLATDAAYMPVQTVSMLESLAVDPGASELEVAKSVDALIRYAITLAMELKMNEVYWICKDENVNRLAERHGCELVLNDLERGKLWRLKVSKI